LGSFGFEFFVGDVILGVGLRFLDDVLGTCGLTARGTFLFLKKN